MEKRVEKYISNNNLINNKTIVIALSGGVDSMVLFDILNKLGYKTVIAHVNHNVRLESEMECEKIKELANLLSIPFETIKLPKIESNFQEEARQLRYRFFMDVANKYHTKLIATAHHCDDLIETSLMKIVRGSNILGYAGIKNKVQLGDYFLIRPLLCVNKDEILKYAKDNNITFYEDSSNSTDHYTRNRFRHHVVPILKEENENIYEAFTLFSNQLIKSFTFIRGLSTSYLNKWNQVINCEEFNSLDDVIKNDIISSILEANKTEHISTKIEAILSILKGDKPNTYIDLGQRKIFRRSYNKAYIDVNKCSISYDIEISDYGSYFLPNGDEIIYTKNMQFENCNYINICYNKIMELPIRVRSRTKGDIIHFDYGNKKVKKLLIEKKIPADIRDIIPIVTDNKNNIIGIIGIGPIIGPNQGFLVWKRRQKNA